MEHLFTSRDLQLHHEAEAMAGRGVSRRHPALYEFLIRHLDEAKRARLAKSEEARLKREARWLEIASGKRPALLVSQLDNVIGKSRKYAEAA